MKKLIIWILIIAVVGTAIYFGLQYATKAQVKYIEILQDKIDFLKEETVPIRFKITDKQNDTINITFKFYDQRDSVIKSVDTKIYGNEISFDFIVLPVNDKYIAFPSKIFTDQIAAQDGIVLFDYYDNNDFPQIFYNDNLTPEFKDALIQVYSKLKKGDVDDIKGVFGSMVQDLQQLKSFDTGIVYKIVVHTKGGIEIIED